jgi:serine/threonine protein kinase
MASASVESEFRDFVLAGYRLERLIARGGISEIWSAVHVGPGERMGDAARIAMKVPRPEFRDDPDVLLAFRAEAALAGRFDHPNLVPILGGGEDPDSGLVYVAMPEIAGRPVSCLRHAPDRPLDPVSLERILSAVRQAALGLGALHAYGLVHADVKPANLLQDGDGLVRVTDFGAHVPLSGISSHGRKQFHTPEYAAPEQLRRESVSPQTDQYSLAKVGYELLTGLSPEQASRLRRRGSGLVLPHELGPTIPRHISLALITALDADPAKRFPSMDAFTLALDPPTVTVSDRGTVLEPFWASRVEISAPRLDRAVEWLLGRKGALHLRAGAARTIRTSWNLFGGSWLWIQPLREGLEKPSLGLQLQAAELCAASLSVMLLAFAAVILLLAGSWAFPAVTVAAAIVGGWYSRLMCRYRYPSSPRFSPAGPELSLRETFALLRLCVLLPSGVLLAAAWIEHAAAGTGRPLLVLPVAALELVAVFSVAAGSALRSWKALRAAAPFLGAGTVAWLLLIPLCLPGAVLLLAASCLLVRAAVRFRSWVHSLKT